MAAAVLFLHYPFPVPRRNIRHSRGSLISFLPDRRKTKTKKNKHTPGGAPAALCRDRVPQPQTTILRRPTLPLGSLLLVPTRCGQGSVASFFRPRKRGVRLWVDVMISHRPASSALSVAGPLPEMVVPDHSDGFPLPSWGCCSTSLSPGAAGIVAAPWRCVVGSGKTRHCGGSWDPSLRG